MSKFNSAKKLQPTTKAWKSFKARLQSQLRHLKHVQPITTLRQRCQSMLSFLRRQLLSLTKPRPSRSTYHLHRHRHHFQPSFSPVYVDNLFPQTLSLQEVPPKDPYMAGSSNHKFANKSKPGLVIESQNNGKIQMHDSDQARIKFPEEDAKGLVEEKGKTKIKESSKKGDQWKIPMMPKFKGIDERAEEFIAKVRQDMKLEREKSILEFEERLKRSS